MTRTAPIRRAIVLATAGATAGLLLAGCTAGVEVDMRNQMIGMSDGDLASCLGQPSETVAADPVQIKKYVAPQMTGGTSCTITASFKDGKLATLDYASSGPSEMDGDCSWVLQRCLPYLPATIR